MSASMNVHPGSPGSPSSPGSSDAPRRAPYELGPVPRAGAMRTIDERFVRARLATIFRLARDVERWPALLTHYRFVRFRERTTDDGGLVEMSANRPFGPLDWPTWWLSEMAVLREGGPRGSPLPRIRFRHVEGITAGMEVEWSFQPGSGGTRVRILHVWNGRAWPVIGQFAASRVIGPVFVHGIAARTLEGLANVAEAEPL